MTLYQKLQKQKFNFAAIGLEQRGLEEYYFCTPKGAKIIGWAGVDGIHYCTIRGFGEMIFAVSPMNLPGDYVHPIARSFDDLLGLLRVCGSMDAIEQVHMWKQEQFEDYVKENLPTEEFVLAMKNVQEKHVIPCIEDAFSYIKELQASFDYSRIRYTEDYYDEDLNPAVELEAEEWKVTFDGDFHRNRGRAGKEISVKKEFVWGEEKWYIPSIYACKEGLIVDFCKEMDADKMKAYLEKWNLPESMWQYSEEQEEMIRNENPMNAEFGPMLFLNGKELQWKHSYGISWIPDTCIEEDGYREESAKRVLEYYGLDMNHCWTIRRFAFAWATKNKPTIKSINILMKRDPETVYGEHFVTPLEGNELVFTHPVTGIKYTLNIQGFDFQQMKQEHFRNDEMEYPEHFAALTYTVEPELSGREFMLRDCNHGDNPRRKNPSPDGFSPVGAASVAIIGGADGPTVIFLSNGRTAKCRMACSSLYFEEQKNIEWRMEFQVKTMEDIVMKIV